MSAACCSLGAGSIYGTIAAGARARAAASVDVWSEDGGRTQSGLEVDKVEQSL